MPAWSRWLIVLIMAKRISMALIQSTVFLSFLPFVLLAILLAFMESE